MSVEPTANAEDIPPQGTPTGELSLAENARRVPVPFGGGNEYVCPNCLEAIPNRRVIYLAKPPQFAHLLNDVIRCPRERCRFVFSPRSEAVVVRS